MRASKAKVGKAARNRAKAAKAANRLRAVKALRGHWPNAKRRCAKSWSASDRACHNWAAKQARPRATP
jgi:hypothetical protein